MTESFITIDASPADATTDARTGLRWYDWQGRPLLSVTSARRTVGIPHGLHQWTLSQVIARALDQHDELHSILERPRRPRERVRDKNVREEAARWLRAGATEERDRKGALGTAVHDLARMLTRPEDVPEVVKASSGGREFDVPGPLIAPRLAAFHLWRQEAGITILAAEAQCFNLTVGYAGSMDLLVRARDGSVWVVDIKTGDATYNDYALQLSAYRHAEFIGRSGVVDEALTALLHQASGMAVLHLDDEGAEPQLIRDDEETWNAYRALVYVARWMTAHPTGESVITAKRRLSLPRAA